LLGLTAIVSVLANQLSAVTSVPRITSSLADQGMLPKWFGQISPRFATPVNSIVTVGVLGIGLALTGTFVTLAIISSLSRLFAYLTCIAAVPRLDFKQGRTRWLQGIVVPAIAACLCVWAALQSQASEWEAFLGFLLAGCFLYLVARLGRQVS
jgi:amino acid transporter